ncbi:hypothetical protein FOMPIDRAFT_1026127 [Fomitopsis schrenkii]|uniref:Uncharacterized protein n=1 Tax=Fomitopsis schrenkii TaxID=2126942 RepID=S8EYF8_FOMSC|nr:hypothetical protein FOMPIDRAFT_1026127 [Fomitopsis schrenkii]
MPPHIDPGPSRRASARPLQFARSLARARGGGRGGVPGPPAASGALFCVFGFESRLRLPYRCPSLDVPGERSLGGWSWCAFCPRWVGACGRVPA